MLLLRERAVTSALPEREAQARALKDREPRGQRPKLRGPLSPTAAQLRGRAAPTCRERAEAALAPEAAAPEAAARAGLSSCREGSVGGGLREKGAESWKMRGLAALLTRRKQEEPAVRRGTAAALGTVQVKAPALRARPPGPLASCTAVLLPAALPGRAQSRDTETVEPRASLLPLELQVMATLPEAAPSMREEALEGTVLVTRMKSGAERMRKPAGPGELPLTSALLRLTARMSRGVLLPQAVEAGKEKELAPGLCPPGALRGTLGLSRGLRGLPLLLMSCRLSALPASRPLELQATVTLSPSVKTAPEAGESRVRVGATARLKEPLSLLTLTFLSLARVRRRA